ncbi:STAS domain-containing protein [Kutzneria kofuensis]|uniref:Anti-anti-sigma regulatory factor n=1 Tax=Kutzneria kofuensis TaxID=103725 RepID=A0A7W9NM47_9PSEU|nr:STAS domain-containing protein [Kutzneria kofuensis]MBB5897141.1 anti-anti-sigma regulatory factor [Kutzneria kofuensis]
MSLRSDLAVDVSQRGKAVLVRLVGDLDLASVAGVRTALMKCVADEPSGVIIQLDRATVVTPLALSVFSVVARRASDWPGLQVMLVARPGRTRELLRRGALDRFVPTFALVAEAMRALQGAPARQVAKLELPPSDGSPALARRFVTETLREWRVDGLTEDACLVVSELVENAILHGQSAAGLRLELRRGRLTIAVRDGSNRAPSRLEPGSAESGGRGVFLVDAMSKAWGTTPTWDGGKVVWAVLAVAGTE